MVTRVRIGDGLLHDSNAEWYVLQEQVRPRQDNRAKCGILDMSTDDVYFTQITCSEYFRSGMALAHLIEQLRLGHVALLQGDSVILNVMQVSVREHRGQVHAAGWYISH